MMPALPDWSVPQEKRPVVASQRSLLEPAVSQSVRPAPENDLVAYTVAPEMVPTTARCAFGAVLPIPTLPVYAMRMRSVIVVLPVEVLKKRMSDGELPGLNICDALK